MNTPNRQRRTFLFVPGDQADKIRKALASPADAVIIDWEDAVAPEHKAAARAITVETLRVAAEDGPPAKPLIIRCNCPSTPWFSEDLARAFPVAADLMLPKCESANDLRSIAEWPRPVIPLLETAAGIHHMEEILAALPQIRQAGFGAVDFALDLGLQWSSDGEERKFALGKLVLISRALGLLPPIDAVYPDLQDEEGFRRDVLHGRRLGCGGKMVIHPRQIAFVQEAYRPTASQIARAKKILAARRAAPGAGAVCIDGQLVDEPVVKSAELLLQEVDPE